MNKVRPILSSYDSKCLLEELDETVRDIALINDQEKLKINENILTIIQKTLLLTTSEVT